MDRNYGVEIDAINEQLSEIKKMLAEFAKPTHTKEGAKPQKTGDFAQGMLTRETFQGKLAEICEDTRLTEVFIEHAEKVHNHGNTGLITYLGAYSSGGQGSVWVREQVDANMLLELIESNAAAKVLACIGNNDRLNMLLALLRAPRTVAQLVEECGYNTTGQVYHHLKPLLAADLVKEDDHNRGNYMLQPHRVQGVIMLLVGISDMLDTKYTQGDWEPAAD